MPARLPARTRRRWFRYKCRWPGRDVWVYRSVRELLVIRRGFRGWCTNVGVWPLPPLAPLAFDDFLQGRLRELPVKRIKPKEQTLARHAALDKEWAKHYPALVGFLSDTEYDQEDGGGKRELGLITVWAGGGFWSAKLRDNDSGHCCYVGGTTLGELFKAADAACSDPGGGWKPDAGAARARKK